MSAQLVPLENGVRSIIKEETLYILIQGDYKLYSDINPATSAIITQQPLFRNDDISPQGQIDLLNFVTDWLINNPSA